MPSRRQELAAILDSIQQRRSELDREELEARQAWSRAVATCQHEGDMYCKHCGELMPAWRKL